jgi:hypothetical protein
MRVLYKVILTILTSSLVVCIGCKKWADAGAPPSSTTEASVYNEDATAIAVMTNIYAQLSTNNPNSTQILPTITKREGLSADELGLMSGASQDDVAYYTNTLAAPISGSGGITPAGGDIWTSCYKYIYTCNSAIEGLTKSSTLTPSVKQQLLGEAKFMRAFFYFYLVNLYGDLPLALTSDYRVTSALPRSSKTLVYQQIINDLKEAQALLSNSFLNGALKNYSSAPQRVRPSSWAATALLARAYLFAGEYALAEQQSNILINNTTLFSLSNLFNVFLNAGLGTNKEAIWQLQPVNTNGTSDDYWNTEDARLFVLTANPVGVNYDHPVFLSPQLLSAFESGDQRAVLGNWINEYTDGSGTYYFSYKYKIGDPVNGTFPTEYLTVFRLAEQYLIRAEARAQLNNINGAQADLNAIRTRAGLPSTTPSDKTSLLAAILHERQVELFCEWGHRWLDLKRTGNIDAVMNVVTPLKASGAIWQSYQQLYPIPVGDVLASPNLTQNIGY